MKRKRKKKKKKLHTPQRRGSIFQDEEMDNEMYMRRQRIYERDEFYELIKHLRNKNLDWRINYFFDRVKEWRKSKKQDFITEMDKYVEFDMKDFKMKRDKETRIRDFVLGLNDYRVTRKVQRKLFDTYCGIRALVHLRGDLRGARCADSGVARQNAPRVQGHPCAVRQDGQEVRHDLRSAARE